MKKMSKTLLVIMMGASLGACSSMDGKNTFMTYADLQDLVQAHESQWQAVQPKLDRLDELEAQVAALTQGESVSPTNEAPDNDNGYGGFNSDSVAAINVAPAVMSSSNSQMVESNTMPKSNTMPEGNLTSEEKLVSEENVVMNRAAPPVVSAPLATAAPASVQPSQFGVQLAAYGIREEALRGWRVLRDAHPDAFVGLEPLLNEKEVNGRSMYQLKVGPFLNRTFSSDFCNMLKGKGQDCLLTQYNGQAL